MYKFVFAVPDSDGNINCVNCKGCKNCENCRNCIGCTNCTSCIKCEDCHHCEQCIYCIGCTESDYCDNCIQSHYCHGNGKKDIYLTDCERCTNCKFTEAATFDVTHCENCRNLIDSHDCINCNTTAEYYSKPSYKLSFCDHCDRCNNCFQCRNLTYCDYCKYLQDTTDASHYYGARDKFRKVRFSQNASLYNLVPANLNQKQFSYFTASQEHPTRLWQILPILNA